jgi:rubrerythrin
MTDRAILSTLQHLTQIDIDAIGAYTRAIEFCRNEKLARTLSAFRGDHERHVRDLSATIEKLGGAPPQAPDPSGLAIEGFTAALSSTGPAGTLMAMQSDEIVTNDAYAQALSRDLPSDLRALVERNLQDERRHLTTIRSWLEENMPAGQFLSEAATIQGWSTAAFVNTLPAVFPLR